MIDGKILLILQVEYTKLEFRAASAFHVFLWRDAQVEDLKEIYGTVSNCVGY